MSLTANDLFYMDKGRRNYGTIPKMAKFTWQTLHKPKNFGSNGEIHKIRPIITDTTGAHYTNALQSGRMYHRADTNLTFSHKQTHYYIPEESFLPNSMPLTLRFSRIHWEPTKSTVGSPPPLFPHYVTTNPWWLTPGPALPWSPGTCAQKVGLSSRS